MIFDASGSEKNPLAIAFFLLIASFPVTCFAAIIMGAKNLVAGNNSRLCYWMCLPFPSFVFVGGLLCYAIFFHR